MSSGGGSVSGGNAGAPNMSQALAQAAAVAARIAATAGTTCEEQVRIPESLVTMIVGRGGNDTITHIQAESGCKVQLPQDASDTVITLRGSRETVSKGREMLQQLANRNGGGTVEVVLTINMPPPGPTGYPAYQEITIPGTKVGLVIGKGGDTIKQLQEKTGAKMVIIQEGPNQELIKPLRISGDPQKIEHAKSLVLELIAQKDAAQASNQNRPGGGNYNNFGAGVGGEQVVVFVPKLAVGVVIGKGGDMIRKIQAECGCKLQFIQGKNDEPGDRRCVIQGTHQQVDDAKRTIDGLIDNVMRSQNRNGNGVPADGNNSNYGYGYGVNHAQQPPREEITFMVPASKCGIVIGRGGETIKLINQQSGAYTEMDRNAVNPPSEKLFKSKGTAEQVEVARQMIAEKINMELPVISRKPISGGPPQQQQQQQANYGMQNDANAAAYQQWGYPQQAAWGDQAQQQHMAMGQNAVAAGSQDYSQQWIEYYKSMGMMREADMIDQQLKAKQAAATGQQMASMQQPQQAAQQQQQQQQQSQQANPGAAAAGQQDYSAQWAEYYRSIGKIEEAEAIEKQMKSKQNGQPNAAAGNGGGGMPNAQANANAAAGAPMPQQGGGGGGAMPQNPGAYPQQTLTPSQYAQYSQYYAAAAAAGAAPGNYPQQAYGGYGAPGVGYPSAPQPPAGAGPAGQQKSNNDN